MRFHIPLCGLFIIAVSVAAFGYVVHANDYSNAIKSADIVCTGEPAKTTAAMAKVGTDFRVDRVLKGDIKPGTLITIIEQDDGPRIDNSINTYCIVLIIKKGDILRLSNSQFNVMQASKTANIEPIQNRDSNTALRWEAINSIKDKSIWIKRTGIALSRYLNDSEFATYVKPLESSLKFDTIAAGLDRGDNTLLLPNLQYLTTVTEYKFGIPDPNKTLIGDDDMSDYIDALGDAKIDESLVKPVAHLYDTKCTVRVRRLMASVLRNSKQTQALPALKRMIDDPDCVVRHTAIMGLADIANDGHRGDDNFVCLPNEKELIVYWKSQDLSKYETK